MKYKINDTISINDIEWEIKDHSKINPVRGNIRLIDDLGKIWWVGEGDITSV